MSKEQAGGKGPDEKKSRRFASIAATAAVLTLAIGIIEGLVG